MINKNYLKTEINFIFPRSIGMDLQIKESQESQKSKESKEIRLFLINKKLKYAI